MKLQINVSRTIVPSLALAVILVDAVLVLVDGVVLLHLLCILLSNAIEVEIASRERQFSSQEVHSRLLVVVCDGIEVLCCFFGGLGYRSR